MLFIKSTLTPSRSERPMSQLSDQTNLGRRQLILAYLRNSSWLLAYVILSSMDFKYIKYNASSYCYLLAYINIEFVCLL